MTVNDIRCFNVTRNGKYLGKEKLEPWQVFRAKGFLRKDSMLKQKHFNSDDKHNPKPSGTDLVFKM